MCKQKERGTGGENQSTFISDIQNSSPLRPLQIHPPPKSFVQLGRDGGGNGQCKHVRAGLGVTVLGWQQHRRGFGAVWRGMRAQKISHLPFILRIACEMLKCAAAVQDELIVNALKIGGGDLLQYARKVYVKHGWLALPLRFHASFASFPSCLPAD